MLQASRESPEGVLKRDVNLKLINSYSLHLAFLSRPLSPTTIISGRSTAVMFHPRVPETVAQKDDTDNRHMNNIKIKLIMHEVHKKDDGK